MNFNYFRIDEGVLIAIVRPSQVALGLIHTRDVVEHCLLDSLRSCHLAAAAQSTKRRQLATGVADSWTAADTTISLCQDAISHANELAFRNGLGRD